MARLFNWKCYVLLVLYVLSVCYFIYRYRTLDSDGKKTGKKNNATLLMGRTGEGRIFYEGDHENYTSNEDDLFFHKTKMPFLNNKVNNEVINKASNKMNAPINAEKDKKEGNVKYKTKEAVIAKKKVKMTSKNTITESIAEKVTPKITTTEETESEVATKKDAMGKSTPDNATSKNFIGEETLEDVTTEEVTITPEYVTAKEVAMMPKYVTITPEYVTAKEVAMMPKYVTMISEDATLEEVTSDVTKENDMPTILEGLSFGKAETTVTSEIATENVMAEEKASDISNEMEMSEGLTSKIVNEDFTLEEVTMITEINTTEGVKLEVTTEAAIKEATITITPKKVVSEEYAMKDLTLEEVTGTLEEEIITTEKEIAEGPEKVTVTPEKVTVTPEKSTSKITNEKEITETFEELTLTSDNITTSFPLEPELFNKKNSQHDLISNQVSTNQVSTNQVSTNTEFSTTPFIRSTSPTTISAIYKAPTTLSNDDKPKKEMEDEDYVDDYSEEDSQSINEVSIKKYKRNINNLSKKRLENILRQSSIRFLNRPNDYESMLKILETIQEVCVLFINNDISIKPIGSEKSKYLFNKFYNDESSALKDISLNTLIKLKRGVKYQITVLRKLTKNKKVSNNNLEIKEKALDWFIKNLIKNILEGKYASYMKKGEEIISEGEVSSDMISIDGINIRLYDYIYSNLLSILLLSK